MAPTLQKTRRCAIIIIGRLRNNASRRRNRFNHESTKFFLESLFVLFVFRVFVVEFSSGFAGLG